VRLLRAKCPVSEKARLWTEESLRWLHGEFGDDALRGEVLVPETVFTSASYTGSEDDVSVVLRRLCDRMGVPTESVAIEFDDDPDVTPDPRVPVAHRFSGAAGEYRRRGGVAVLAVRRRQLRYPVALAATLAHELAHARLLGEQRIDAARSDGEQLTPDHHLFRHGHLHRECRLRLLADADWLAVLAPRLPWRDAVRLCAGLLRLSPQRARA
jgi:hypothetical protein